MRSEGAPFRCQMCAKTFARREHLRRCVYEKRNELFFSLAKFVVCHELLCRRQKTRAGPYEFTVAVEPVHDLWQVLFTERCAAAPSSVAHCLVDEQWRGECW